jgi:hypothetical protein
MRAPPRASSGKSAASIQLLQLIFGSVRTSLARLGAERNLSSRAMTGEGWTVDLPEGLIAKPHVAWGYESGVLARGWLEEAPVTVIVQVKNLPPHIGFNEWVRQVAAYWLEQSPPRRIKIPGAGDAVRLDGVIEFDGLGDRDDRERCITVCAKQRRKVFGLTIRSRMEDQIAPLLEPIVESFALDP